MEHRTTEAQGRPDPSDPEPTRSRPRSGVLALLGPGILVAATGVGAGDLATGAIAGSRLGVAVLWAALLGAGLKYLLTEGLARWQLATGTTVLEGAVTHFGRVVQWAFLGYLLLWSYFVGAALMSACGIAAHALVPVLDARGDKIAYGLLHSAAALALLRLGGYRLFQRLMGACVALMFLVVVLTAIGVGAEWNALLHGLLVPGFGDAGGPGVAWTIALIGGVGGTLTILCYGYWIREEGRTVAADLKACRIDLAAGYAMTAVFGVSMVVIGSRIEVEGGGAGLVVAIGERLRDELGAAGPVARWAFLIGAWSAVFSSLLGVWQSVPYLFADFWMLMTTRGAARPAPPDTRAPAYRGFQLALATVPAVGLLASFEQAQKLYAVVGALFIPMLALALLALNRPALVGPTMRNRPVTTALLAATLAFFLLAGAVELTRRYG
jgi:Mn2+/Fe2+ NRAMP family transporter